MNKQQKVMLMCKVKTVSVIGLGKLGAPLLAALASKKINVIGVDLNKDIVKKINNQISPYREKNLQEYLESFVQYYEATTDIEYAVKNSDLCFIIVPTPSQKNGFFDNSFLKKVLKDISFTLKNKPDFFNINITSTVMPGSCENEFIPLIEKFSNKKVNKDFGLTYNPEFIALGSVINDILYPDMLLIGQSGPKAGEMLRSIYIKLCGKKSPLRSMNLINSEIVKISVNTYVTTKISYANMLTEFCEKFKNANIDDVTDAIGLDSRIGRKYLTGGLPYGGPCFPRDNRAFSKLARKLGVNSALALATDSINDYQVNRIIRNISKVATKSKNISILGLSYKNFTPEIDESFSVKIIKRFIASKKNVSVFDFLAHKNTKLLFSNKITYSKNQYSLIKNADILLLVSDDKNYYTKEFVNKLIESKNIVIFDFWRVLNKNKFGSNLIQLGSSNEI